MNLTNEQKMRIGELFEEAIITVLGTDRPPHDGQDVTGKDEPAMSEESPPLIDPYPHVTEAEKWIGIDEGDPKIHELLGDEHDWEVVSWCAKGLNCILERCGIKGTGTMRARDFADWGEEGDGSFGDIAVFDKHVTIIVEDGKALGCNQGNTTKRSNLAWYMQNMQFLGYRRIPQSIEA